MNSFNTDTSDFDLKGSSRILVERAPPLSYKLHADLLLLFIEKHFRRFAVIVQ